MVAMRAKVGESSMNRLVRTTVPTTLVLAVLVGVLGCSRSKPSAASSAESSLPPANTGPAPTFSVAEKIGMFVYPKNNQSRDQQLRDELDCYNQVQQQTGINPDTAPPSGPSSGQEQAAQDQAAAQAPQAQGGRVRGAARGAAGGAMVGAIAGDAGKGAAAGAGVGTMRGGRGQREGNAGAKQKAGETG